jgi:hypothetical protein
MILMTGFLEHGSHKGRTQRSKEEIIYNDATGVLSYLQLFMFKGISVGNIQALTFTHTRKKV